MPRRHILAAAIAQLLLAHTAQAATITVDTSDDSKNTDGNCSLREAIENANNDDQSGSSDCVAGSGADSISLQAGQTITLGSALPQLDGDLTISGNGARIERDLLAGCNLDGTMDAGEFRLLDAGSPTGENTLQFSSLTLANGCADGGSSVFTLGAAIAASGDSASIDSVRFENNQAFLHGGAVVAIGETSGALAISNSTFVGNSAVDLGGALYVSGVQSANLVGSVLSDNHAGNGGGIYDVGNLTISSSTLERNSANNGGGAISIGGGSLSLQRSTLVDNTAGNEGGAIKTLATDVSILGSTLSGNSAAVRAGALQIDGYLNFGGGHSLLDSTLSGNAAPTAASMLLVNTFITSYRSIISSAAVAGQCGNNPPSAYSSLSTDASCGGGATVVSPDQLALQPLAANGGPTRTHALGHGSVAIDAGASGCAATDQRGVARPFGSACDIGAFELDEAANAGPDFVVNANDDPGDGFCGNMLGECTLRDALIAANSNPDASEITFDATVFDGAQIVTLLSQLPTVSTPVTITGLGDRVDRAGGCNLDGTTDLGEFRLMQFSDSPSPSSISGLTLANGCADGIAYNTGDGGAILSGSLSLMLTGMRLENNRAYGRGGALRIGSEGTSAGINDSIFVGNTALMDGGAVSGTSVDLSIQGSTFSGNRGRDGGAVQLSNAHSLGLINSQLSDNSATRYGGAVFAAGGSTLAILTSTLNANTAIGAGGAIEGLGQASITRSLLHGNASGDAGGAVYSNGDLLLDSSTVSGNTASFPGGGIRATGATVEVRDSTLADNQGGSGDQLSAGAGTLVTSLRSLFVGSGTNCYGGSGSPTGGDNLGDDLTGCGPGAVATDGQIGLQALANNGGATQTRALGHGSVAIDAAGNGCSATDQRGVARPYGTACDVGAFEVDEIAQTGAGFEVNVADDLGDGFCGQAIGECTLRDALVVANADADASIVSFDPTVFGSPQTITLSQGELLIASTVTVSGPGRNQLTVDAGGQNRIFMIHDNSATDDISLSDMTLRNGSHNQSGGAIRLHENLTMNAVDIFDSSAQAGSAIDAFIPDAGTFTLNNSQISGNQAGGGNYGAIRLGGQGATITITNSVISDNTATSNYNSRGGGLSVLATFGKSIKIEDSQISGNTLIGSGVKSGAGISIVGSSNFNSQIVLSGLRIENNVAGGESDGAGHGGGLFAYMNYGTLLLQNSTLSGNQALRDGGQAGLGGGFYLVANKTSVVDIANSTLSGNSAGDDGGGLFDSLYDTVQLSLTDSTVSGNTADANGGGVYSANSGVGSNVAIVGSTLFGNSAGNAGNNGYGGGLRALSVYGTLTLSGSVIAGNSSGNASPVPDMSLAGSATLSLDNNLIGDHSGSGLAEAPLGMPDANNNLIGDPSGDGAIDPMVRALTDNGGSTQTHLPLDGSPLIDRFDGCAGNDQRGFARGIDSDGMPANDCDVGAVEYRYDDDVRFRDGFEAAPIPLTFARHAATLKRSAVQQRLAGLREGMPTIVARASEQGGDGLLLVEARQINDRIEVRMSRFEHGEWMSGRWNRVAQEQVELNW